MAQLGTISNIWVVERTKDSKELQLSQKRSKYVISRYSNITLCTYRFLDKAAVIIKEDHATNNIMSPNPWCISSVTKVEEVKMMIRLLPIWATTIIFWTTYAQMITFSVEQASTMERNVGSFKIPAGSLTVFFVLAILISLAVYDRLIIPVWKKWKGKPGNYNIIHRH